MIQVTNLEKIFGDRVLFEEVTFSVGRGERIGLVGRNGSGKSTLFKVLLGKEIYDSGQMVIPKGYKLGTLEQHIEFTLKSVIDECMSVLPAEMQYEGYRAEKYLFGLGFSLEDMDKDPLSFSGGYQIRINLVKTLLLEPDCLLLDEPTNYLDIVSLRWLLSFLKSFRGEVILITHDRGFMDLASTHTMGIHRKKIKKIKGDTQKYYEKLIEEDYIYEQTRQNQEKKVQQMMSYVDRFKAKASKAAQAQSKLKMINKMDRFEKLEDIKNLDFSFNHTKCAGKVILEVKDLSFGFDEPLFSNVSFSVGREDRIGIIGKNGKGKSTLLNVISGVHKLSEGSLWNHSSMSLGHFGQTNVSRLYFKNTIIQEIRDVNAEISISEIRSICGLMLFSGDDAEKKISLLSGGERARVLLGKILAKKTNILFLDEPTNHLDMESIDSLIDAINEYKGASLIVTHNEEILRKCVNKLLIFMNGNITYFDGNYDDFLKKIGWEVEENGKIANKKNIVREDKDQDQFINKIKTLEAQVETLEKYQRVLEEDLIKASSLNELEKITDISNDIKIIESKIEKLFDGLEKLEKKVST